MDHVAGQLDELRDLCNKVESNSTMGLQSSLCRITTLAYQCRGSGALRLYMKKNLCVQARAGFLDTAADEIVERIGKLARFYRARKTIATFTAWLANAGVNITVRGLPSCKLQVEELKTRTASDNESFANLSRISLFSFDGRAPASFPTHQLPTSEEVVEVVDVVSPSLDPPPQLKDLEDAEYPSVSHIENIQASSPPPSLVAVEVVSPSPDPPPKCEDLEDAEYPSVSHTENIQASSPQPSLVAVEVVSPLPDQAPQLRDLEDAEYASVSHIENIQASLPSPSLVAVEVASPSPDPPPQCKDLEDAECPGVSHVRNIQASSPSPSLVAVEVQVQDLDSTTPGNSELGGIDAAYHTDVIKDPITERKTRWQILREPAIIGAVMETVAIAIAIDPKNSQRSIPPTINHRSIPRKSLEAPIARDGRRGVSHD
ncbi:hypothetical protein DV738_g2599, partial [Chaetothyriales sp. CBS 135597]